MTSNNLVGYNNVLIVVKIQWEIFLVRPLNGRFFGDGTIK